MAAPSVLLGSCFEFDLKNLVREILDSEELPAFTSPLPEISAYNWAVDTKYYTADVNLCIAASRTIGTEEFADSVQAIILVFDSKDEDSFKLLQSWIPFVDLFKPAVQLLVCQRSTQIDAVPRAKVFNWCLDHDFELIELDPEEESEDEEEDAFKDVIGVKRIVQALHSHPWPNLTMKEQQPFHKQALINGLMSQNEIAAGNDEIIETSPEQDSSNLPVAAATGQNKNNILDEQIDALLKEDLKAFESITDEDEDSFEKLFEKMSLMKEKTDKLDPEARKLYAEKVAISFWKAIGGDDSEIEGLDDESD
ncbi:alpha- and gamma-adaptin-binding protein p34-like [Tubulanus polymorphus]|uniref:alpha- and gamma-adaptin-binding protein p34-like n=1 Tax=Tubulanus polymorphus TaxID=672921 RepID=UPI003DA40B19